MHCFFFAETPLHNELSVALVVSPVYERSLCSQAGRWLDASLYKSDAGRWQQRGSIACGGDFFTCRWNPLPNFTWKPWADSLARSTLATFVDVITCPGGFTTRKNTNLLCLPFWHGDGVCLSLQTCLSLVHCCYGYIAITSQLWRFVVFVFLINATI